MPDAEEVIITEITGFGEARNDEGKIYLMLTASTESGKAIQLAMPEEAAARALLLLDKARRRLGWKLRDAEIDIASLN